MRIEETPSFQKKLEVSKKKKKRIRLSMVRKQKVRWKKVEIHVQLQ